MKINSISLIRDVGRTANRKIFKYGVCAGIICSLTQLASCTKEPDFEENIIPQENINLHINDSVNSYTYNFKVYAK